MPIGSGRRPLPTAIRKLRGNPSDKPLNDAEPKPSPGRPERPRDLHGLARKEWDSTVPELEAMGVLARVDAKALAAYCREYANWIRAEKDCQKRGLILEEPIVTRDGVQIGVRVKRNPAVQVANDALRLMKAFMIEFGMTPAARSRIRIEKPKQEDQLETFLKRGKTQTASVN